MKQVKASSNIFVDLGFSEGEAENFKIRSSLMIEVEQYIITHKLTQSEAAKFFGVTQPRISNLMCGKIEKFTIDILVNMLAKAGMKISFAIEKTPA